MTIKKRIYLIFGVLFFSLGLFGYYMPIVPGTIFMIIAAYCFMHSSDKLYNKIINHPLYGKHVKQYVEHHTIPLKSKVIILVSMWFATLLTICIAPEMKLYLGMALFNRNLVVNFKLIGFILSIIGTIVVLRAKNKKL